MSAIRRMAAGMLDAIVKHSSTAEARSWASAMAREIDFIEDDWSAVRWALGSTTALCRRSVSEQLRALFRRTKLAQEDLAKKLPLALLGMLAAGAVLTVCLLLLSSLLRSSWFDPAQRKFVDRLLFVGVPETLYLASAVALWRHRKGVAVGILAAGLILMIHAVVHFVSHG